MKKLLIAAAGLMVTIALPVSGIAQGRHDEKPHGMMSSVHEVGEQARQPATGGRHDEGHTTHGQKQGTAKQEAGKPDKSPTGQ